MTRLKYLDPSDGQYKLLPVGGGAAGVTDHGALSGLGDDDHPQYHNDARGDARYPSKSYVDTADAARVLKTGDTMTGDLTMTKSSPAITLDDTGAAGTTNADIRIARGGATRWILRQNSDAESGSDTGSNLEIISRTDAGASKLSVLKFLRNTGHAIFGSSVAITDRLTSLRGVDMGSTVASSGTDLTRHLSLYGVDFGLNVTASTLNYVASKTHLFREMPSGAEQCRIDSDGLKMPLQRAISVGPSKEMYVGDIVWGTSAQAVGYVGYDPGMSVVDTFEISISGGWNNATAMGRIVRRSAFYLPRSATAPTFYGDDMIESSGDISYYYWIGPGQSWQTNPKLILWPVYKAGGVNTDLVVTVKSMYGSPIEGGKLWCVAPDIYNHNQPLPHPYWVSLGLQNGWTNLDARTARIRRAVDNTVHLSGVITGGTTGSVICNIPAGWRPARGSVDLPVGVASGVALLNCAADGTVKVVNPTAGGNPTSYTYLDCSYAI